HAPCLDLERATGRIVLGEGGGDLLPDDERGQLDAPVDRDRLRPGRGHVALILVPDRQRDADPTTKVVEGVLDRPGPAAVGQTVEAKAHLLTLVADRHARVPAPLRLLLAHLPASPRRVRPLPPSPAPSPWSPAPAGDPGGRSTPGPPAAPPPGGAAAGSSSPAREKAAS